MYPLNGIGILNYINPALCYHHDHHTHVLFSMLGFSTLFSGWLGLDFVFAFNPPPRTLELSKLKGIESRSTA